MCGKVHSVLPRLEHIWLQINFPTDCQIKRNFLLACLRSSRKELNSVVLGTTFKVPGMLSTRNNWIWCVLDPNRVTRPFCGQPGNNRCLAAARQKKMCLVLFFFWLKIWKRVFLVFRRFFNKTSDKFLQRRRSGKSFRFFISRRDSLKWKMTREISMARWKFLSSFYLFHYCLVARLRKGRRMTRINCLIIKFSRKPESFVKSVNAKSLRQYTANISHKQFGDCDCRNANKSRLSVPELLLNEISSSKLFDWNSNTLQVIVKHAAVHSKFTAVDLTATTQGNRNSRYVVCIVPRFSQVQRICRG